MFKRTKNCYPSPVFHAIKKNSEDSNGITLPVSRNISEEKKKHIFDMFYMANEKIVDSRRSLGLGLALCRSIVTAHGGTIRVYDNHPKGSVFDFTLPLEEVAIHE